MTTRRQPANPAPRPSPADTLRSPRRGSRRFVFDALVRGLVAGLLVATILLAPPKLVARPAETHADAAQGPDDGRRGLNACVDEIVDVDAPSGARIVILVDEQGQVHERASHALPEGIEEGDCLQGGRLDIALTRTRRAEARALILHLISRGSLDEDKADAPSSAIEEL
jgi:hypothetical protein